MPAGYTVEGEAQTIEALEKAAAAATAISTMIAAADLVLPAARMLGPNVTGSLAGSYQTMHGDPPGIASPLIYGGIIEYGWPAHDRPAQLRVARAFAEQLPEVERLIGERVEQEGDRLGL